MMSEQREIIARRVSIVTLNRILEEVARQDIQYDTPYAATADGIRLAMAHTIDSIDSAVDLWRTYKLTSNWAPGREELIQASAHLIRVIRELGIEE